MIARLRCLYESFSRLLRAFLSGRKKIWLERKSGKLRTLQGMKATCSGNTKKSSGPLRLVAQNGNKKNTTTSNNYTSNSVIKPYLCIITSNKKATRVYTAIAFVILVEPDFRCGNNFIHEICALVIINWCNYCIARACLSVTDVCHVCSLGEAIIQHLPFLSDVM